MENCEICGTPCTDTLCDECAYRMRSGNNTDIGLRVAEHDNREYEIVQRILKFYGITYETMFAPDSRQPGSQARQLYAYCMVTELGWKYDKVAEIIHCKRPYIAMIMAKFSQKFKSEQMRKKFSEVVNF